MRKWKFYFLFYLIVFTYASSNESNSSQKNDTSTNIKYGILSEAVQGIYSNIDTIDRFGRIPPQISAILIYRAMRSTDISIRLKAATAAGNANDFFGTPYLVDLLEDDVFDIRQAAKKSLWQIHQRDLSVSEWREFWHDQTRNLGTVIAGVIFMSFISILLLAGIVKKTVKAKQLWYMIPFLIAINFFIFIGGFTDWFGTRVFYFNGEPIYYKTSHAFIGLCSCEDYNVAVIIKQIWAVIGICILIFIVWQGVRYLQKEKFISSATKM